MENKLRLDAALVSRGLTRSRETAKTAIENGKVDVNGVTVRKSAFPVSPGDEIVCREDKDAFVSRGGYKLQKALQVFCIDLKGKTCLDIGASTGGFTDCMLKAGALSVTAVEGGHGQLSPTLLSDPRVLSYEKTDVRRMPPEITSRKYDFIASDLSFISLKLVFPSVFPLLAEDGSAVFLIKPQFEAGREAVGKNGIVKNEKDHLRVIRDLLFHLRSTGVSILGLTWSPITGGDGNVEYLLWAAKNRPDAEPDAAGTVRYAMEELKRGKRR